MPDLNTFYSIQENYFVELNINGSYTRFSDYHKAFTVDSNSYDALGSLLGITATKQEVRASQQALSISISGIPSTNLALVQNADIKGSTVTVRRALFNVTTGALLSTTETNPVIKFKGVVNNFGIEETWNTSINDSTFALTLQVNSIIGQLLKRTAGRRTNPVDQKKFFSTDTSMDRVPVIRNSNYNFGAPDIVPRIGTK